MKILYKVVFGNYYPREVDSEHLIKDEAEERVRKLGGMWRLEECQIPEFGDRNYNSGHTIMVDGNCNMGCC